MTQILPCIKVAGVGGRRGQTRGRRLKGQPGANRVPGLPVPGSLGLQRSGGPSPEVGASPSEATETARQMLWDWGGAAGGAVTEPQAGGTSKEPQVPS